MSVTPIIAATDVLDRADALLALDNDPNDPQVRTDLRRLAWAMGVAAIDTYLHWLVRGVDLRAPLPASLAKVDIPFGDLVEMGRTSVKARRDHRDDRPLVRARNVLHKRILQDTYQSPRKIEQALALVGVRSVWRQLSTDMGEAPQDIKDHLNRLAARRNCVVHEGDIIRQSRPREVRHSALSAADARKELDWVRQFVGALGRLAP